MADYYDELLTLCGFEDQEINEERARIEKTFWKLELLSDDMKTAESWVRKNHDVELLGVRKILRLWLKELIDLVLAREEGKILIYYGFPNIPGPGAALAAASDKIYCLCPDVVLAFTLGQIFNKIAPILEAAERNGLPPGYSLCSLQQTRVGGMAKGIIPVADLVLTSSYYCDMGSKTDELIHERYGHPAVYVDGSMDSRWGEFPDYLQERVSFLGGEFDRAFDRVKEILGIEVTEAARYQGASPNREMADASNQLLALLKEADPQPISVIELTLAKMLTAASAGRRVTVEAAEAIKILNSEVKERIDKGIGIVEKGAPRVAISFENFSDPGIVHMMEKCGLSVPTALLYLVDARFRQPPHIISGELLARTEMEYGNFHSSYGFIKRAAEVTRESNLDGIIWSYLYNCRPLTQMSHLFKQYVEKETGVPVLSLESDLVDNRTYSAEAQRIKVETFAEMLRARKSSVGNDLC